MRWERHGAAWMLAATLALPGCATFSSLPGLGGAKSGPEAGTEIRPDAPPEYDVLVAQMHASEGELEPAIAAYQRAVAKDEKSPYLHRVLADALARASRLDEALAQARRAHELDPSDTATRNLLAQLYRVKRDAASAEAVLTDGSGNPLDSTAAFLLYQLYLENDRAPDALRVAQWMVANDEDPLRARVAVANAYQKMNRPLDAERALRDALEVDPGNLRIYSALARSMRERGDRAGEIAVYREVLSQHPDDHSTLAALADAQMAQDDLEGAIGTLLQIEDRYPDDLRSVMRLGFLLLEARRFDEASQRFERVLAVSPEEHEVAFFLGVARHRANEDEAALKAFESIPEGDENYAQARTQIAAIHERHGDYKAAIAEVDKAQAAEPSRQLQLYRATLQAKGGDLAGAVAYLQALLDKEPDNDELVYNMGVVYGEGGQTDKAIELMQHALALNPDNASALNYIGYTWAERGENLDQAQKMIEHAIELRPDDGYIVDSLGWVYYMRARPLVKSGRRAEARKYIDRAIEELQKADKLTGGDPVISEHLGDTYLLLDERRRALDKFEEATNLGPREDEQPELKHKLEALRREFE